MKFKLVILLGALASIAIGAGWHATQGMPNQRSSLDTTKTLRRGLGSEPGSLDPGGAADSFSLEVLGDLYEGLMAESADGNIVPGVADSWSVDSTGTRYDFHLRRDARWSNGASIRARDFVNAWRRVVDPKQASPMADNLRIVRGAEDIIAGQAIPSSLGVSAVSDDQLVVELTRPAPYFLQLLTHYCTFPVFSEAAARSHDSKTWVSNGAYVLVRWEPGGTLQLVKNPSYWDRAHVGIGFVVYVPLPDENGEWLRYPAGQLDLTQNVPAAALASIREERPSELHIAPFLGTMYYAFNLRSAPFKGNIALRKALVMAIDRRAILQYIQPFGQQPAFGFAQFLGQDYRSSLSRGFVFSSASSLPSDALRTTYEEVCGEFLSREHIRDLPSLLAGCRTPLRREGVEFILSAVHRIAISTILSVHRKHGRLPPHLPNSTDDSAAVNPVASLARVLVQLKDGGESINQEALSRVFQASSDLRKHHALGQYVGDGETARALHSLFHAYPDEYLDALGQLVYFNWVTACFMSAEPTDAALWAHYGDNHQGVCLKFAAQEGPAGPCDSIARTNGMALRERSHGSHIWRLEIAL